MLAAPFASGVGIYTFYALQPYLLELWGDPKAYSDRRAGGGDRRRRADPRRLPGAVVPAAVPQADDGADPRRGRQRGASSAALGLTDAFWVALVLLALWAMVFAAEMPIRQAYLNDMIPSRQRATVLSFDSLMGSSGGVVIQPVLGRAADVYSYSTSLVIGAAIQLVAVPFLVRSRREGSPADVATALAPVAPACLEPAAVDVDAPGR